MTNDKDSKTIHDLFSQYHYADDLGVIKSKLAEYVVTTRLEAVREGREKAFRRTREAVGDLGVDETSSYEVREGFIQCRQKVFAAIDAIEAAAKEGSGE